MLFPIARFKVQDRSMEPEFKSGDYVIVNKLAYIFSKPSKNDVIVLKHPEEMKFLIKRISLITNSDEYYVVGDNKGFSQDSRHFGPVKKDLILGKVLFQVKR